VPDEEETDFGFTVQEVTENLYRSHRLSQRDGVLVSFVERGSEAEEAGMNAGDLVVQVESAEIADIASFRSSIGQVGGSAPFLVRARRGADLRYLLIVPRETAKRAQSPAPAGS
jgi:S1-C subfamily serine protease